MSSMEWPEILTKTAKYAILHALERANLNFSWFRRTTEPSFRKKPKNVLGLEVLDTSPLTTDEERDLGLGLSDKNHTIFLYTGGQGPIEEFYYNSGYLIDLARYYGVNILPI